MVKRRRLALIRFIFCCTFSYYTIFAVVEFAFYIYEAAEAEPRAYSGRPSGAATPCTAYRKYHSALNVALPLLLHLLIRCIMQSRLCVARGKSV